MRVGLSVLVVLEMSMVSISALAQVQPERTTAALVLAEGAVYLNDTAVEATAAPSVLPEVAVLRTAQGRAAIALKRGGWLFLDADSSVRVFGNAVYNFNRLEVLSGSAIVSSETSAPLIDCESEIRLSSGGLFRFDAQPANARGERPCRFRVYDGAAAVPLVNRYERTSCGPVDDVEPSMRRHDSDYRVLTESARWVRSMGAASTTAAREVTLSAGSQRHGSWFGSLAPAA